MGRFIRRRKATDNGDTEMILYEPVSNVEDHELHRKLFFQYIHIKQYKDFLKVLQTKTDEYIREVQYRYKRRYCIKNIILRKIKEILKCCI